MCRLTYRVLKHIVQDYRYNEEYASQWINLYLSQALNTGEANDIYAEMTITTILTNNKRLLETVVNR